MGNYVSVRMKKDTYRELKHIAVDLDTTLVAVIDMLLERYKQQKGGLSFPKI